MMKLVDMRGLKLRPSKGPGSSPGTGNVASNFLTRKGLMVLLYLGSSLAYVNSKVFPLGAT